MDSLNPYQDSLDPWHKVKQRGEKEEYGVKRRGKEEEDGILWLKW